MLTRFCLYGFLKNQRYFEPFLMLAFLEQGLSYFWIGVLIAIRSLTINLLEIPSGAIADTWGRRGSMIASFVAYIISFFVFAFASMPAWFALAMVLYGIGDSFRTGTHKSMIFEWVRLQGRQDERTKIYGLTRSWSKYGSAVSSILAAIFVIVSGNYRAIFLFSTVPYFLNLINFLGYPSALEGETVKQRTVRQTWNTLWISLKQSIQQRSLRRLMAESMSWEGLFHAVKDYIQPVLASSVVIWLIGQNGDADDRTSTAITIGVVYTVLFLLSGIASRLSHRFASWSGNEETAARRLWIFNLILYVLLGVFAWYGQLWVVVLMFVGLNVLQNVWRPILINRFDQHTPAAHGATVLSIESQAQRIATLVVAPAIGWWIDRISTTDQSGGFWPIGLVGAAAALLMLVPRTIHTDSGRSK